MDWSDMLKSNESFKLKKEMKSTKIKFNINIQVSDAIPLNREVPDSRPRRYILERLCHSHIEMLSYYNKN